MTDADREARNEEHKIVGVETDFATIVVYRGALELLDDGRGLVTMGAGVVVEVNDHADSEIWFEVDDDEATRLAQMFLLARHGPK